MNRTPFDLDLPSLILGPRKVYPPVGQCIYCGVTGVPLTNEHIMPFSLAGREELPQASCRKCAAITSDVERIYTRSIYGDLRVHLGLPTRRPKKRAKHFPILRFNSAGIEEIAHVPTKEHPLIAFFPVFDPPGLLRGAIENKSFQMVGYQYGYFREQAEGLYKYNGIWFSCRIPVRAWVT